MATKSNTATYCAYYAKIGIDKHAPTGQKITLHQACWLSPPTTSKAEADQDARDLVNSYGSVAATTILPRVFIQQDDETYLDVCYRAWQWFEDTVRDMNESDAIASRNRVCH